MKKLILVGILSATVCFGVHAQSPYGEHVGLSYYDLPSNGSAVDRIVYNEDDQSVSITWIQSITALTQPTFERGAGYNHMLGGVWQYGTDGACRVNNACTQEYSGWPEIINFPKEDVVFNGVTYTDVSREVILAHSGGLKTISRGYRGVNNWEPVQKLLFDQNYCTASTEGLWARAVREGNRTIHAVAFQGLATGEGVPCSPYTSLYETFLYYRSSDQGKTWDIQNYILDGMKDTTYFTQGDAESYAIAAKGNTVAVLAGGNRQPWTLFKSLDKGLTWDFHVIKPWDPNVIFEKGYFSSGEDGKEATDGSHSVVIDDDGTVHCFTGVVIVAVDPATGEYGGQAVFGNSGIWYWNDAMTDFCEPTLIADLIDYGTHNGTSFTYHGTPKYSDDASWDPFDGMGLENSSYFSSSTTMPSAATDSDGNIYVTYAADVEGTYTNSSDINVAVPFKDIYMVWSNDGGTTWSRELNISSDIAGYDDGSGGTGIEEDVFPSVAHEIGSDNMLHIMWNMDYKPGSDVRLDNGEFSAQYVSYYGVDVTALTMDVGTVVTSSPNMITALSDTMMTNGQIYEADIQEGFYATLSPGTSFWTPDTIICVECDSSAIASIDSIWCTGCGAGGVDTLSVVDTAYTDTITSINPMGTDLNADGDSLFSISTDSSGTYTFTAVYGNACPDATTEFTLTSIGGTVQAVVTDSDTLTICEGDSVTLTGIGGGGTGDYDYLWNNAGADTTASITVSPSVSTTYTFSATEGTTGVDSVRVEVNALPASNNAGTDVSLTIDCGNPTPFANLGSGSAVAGLSYSWSPQVGMSADDALTLDPVVLPSTTTVYTLTTTDDATTCQSTDEVTISVSGDCVVPGIVEQLNFNLSIYPIPSKENVTIEVKDAIMNSVTIYNNLGAVVGNKVVKGKQKYSIDVSGYTAGIYYIYLETDKGQATRQITVIE